MLLAVFLVGCGGSDTSPLVGAWEYVNNANSVAEVLTFDDSGTYRADLVVFTSASAANDQRESGTWDVSGSTVTLTQTQSTCAGLSSATLGWKRSGTELTLTATQGEVIYTALSGSAQGFTGLALAFGCNVNGTWVPAQ